MGEGTYSVVTEDENGTDSTLSVNQMSEMLKLFRDSDDPKRKKKKKEGKKKKSKSKKKKEKKREKALAYFFDSDKKSKKKSKKKKKSKGKKQAERELKHRLIEKTADATLDTASYGAKRYFDHKWSVSDREAKGR